MISATLIDNHWALTSKRCCEDKKNAKIDIGLTMVDRSSRGISGNIVKFNQGDNDIVSVWSN